MSRRRTVILAAGDFPKKGSAARKALNEAVRVICCDGAADVYRRRTGKEPFAVVGDCDSLKGRFSNVVADADQDTNDLEKAVQYCKGHGWKYPLVVGAFGKREDHSIGNVFRALDLELEVLTDTGRFVPVMGKAVFRVKKGTPVSVFATDPATKAKSKGLQWKLDGVNFKNLYCATLNRASASKVEILSNKRILIYIPINEKRDNI